MSVKSEICLELIRILLERGRVTRAEFIRETGYRPASVLEAVDELKKRKLAIEPDRNGLKTGRLSPALELNADYGNVLGIEVEPDHLRFVELNIAGARRAAWTTELKPDQDAESIRATLAAELAQHPNMIGVGLADSGLVDAAMRNSLGAVGIPGWERVSLGNFLQQHSLSDAATVVPECAARAFCEYMRVPAENRNGSLFLLHLDKGVGAGFIQNGELFRGDNCRGMELGHLVVKPDGPICGCGSRGCLEALVGEAGVIRRATELLDHQVRTSLTRDDLSLESFVAAVKRRDRAAELLALDLCREIAPVFPMVATLLNPARIVLSGCFSHIGPMLIESARKLLAERCLRGTFEGTKISVSTGDCYDAAHGAALLIRRQFLMRG